MVDKREITVHRHYIDTYGFKQFKNRIKYFYVIVILFAIIFVVLDYIIRSRYSAVSQRAWEFGIFHC